NVVLDKDVDCCLTEAEILRALLDQVDNVIHSSACARVAFGYPPDPDFRLAWRTAIHPSLNFSDSLKTTGLANGMPQHGRPQIMAKVAEYQALPTRGEISRACFQMGRHRNYDT